MKALHIKNIPSTEKFNSCQSMVLNDIIIKQEILKLNNQSIQFQIEKMKENISKLGLVRLQRVE